MKEPLKVTVEYGAFRREIPADFERSFVSRLREKGVTGSVALIVNSPDDISVSTVLRLANMQAGAIKPSASKFIAGAFHLGANGATKTCFPWNSGSGELAVVATVPVSASMPKDPETRKVEEIILSCVRAAMRQRGAISSRYKHTCTA